ncbi:MAG: hypothetical protein QXL94_09320 [Candidatus Parvarchaeum sp.]
MPILKCTKKLIRAFGKNIDKIFSAPENKTDTSILGNWTAHLVIYTRTRFVLALVNKTPRIKRENIFPEKYVR